MTPDGSSFYQVPAGKRLVVEGVYLEVDGPDADVSVRLTADPGSGALRRWYPLPSLSFVKWGLGRGTTVGGPVRAYFEPGTALSLEGNTNTGSIVWHSVYDGTGVIVGHYVPAT
jgi:hypothetical protein